MLEEVIQRSRLWKTLQLVPGAIGSPAPFGYFPRVLCLPFPRLEWRLELFSRTQSRESNLLLRPFEPH